MNAIAVRVETTVHHPERVRAFLAAVGRGAQDAAAAAAGGEPSLLLAAARDLVDEGAVHPSALSGEAAVAFLASSLRLLAAMGALVQGPAGGWEAAGAEGSWGRMAPSVWRDFTSWAAGVEGWVALPEGTVLEGSLYTNAFLPPA